MHPCDYAIHATLKDAADRVEDISKARLQVDALLRVFEGDDGIDISVRWGFSLSFSGDKKRLAQVMAKVRRLGYEWDKESAKKADKVDSLAMYCRILGEDGYRDENTVALTVRFASTVCKRVYVGTKKVTKEVEESIYEMQCE